MPRVVVGSLRGKATHLDAIVCPGNGQYVIVDARSAVVEELVSVAVLNLLRWALFISFAMQLSDAAMGEWLLWVGSSLRTTSSWRTRSSAIAERASHSAFACKISPRSKTTGFTSSDADMLTVAGSAQFIQLFGDGRIGGETARPHGILGGRQPLVLLPCRRLSWCPHTSSRGPSIHAIPSPMGNRSTLIGAATNRPQS